MVNPSPNNPFVVPDRNNLSATTSTPTLTNPFTPYVAPDYNTNTLILSPAASSASMQLPAGTGAIIGDGTPAASTNSADASLSFTDLLNQNSATQDTIATDNFLGMPPADPLDIGSLQDPSSIFQTAFSTISSALGGSAQSLSSFSSIGADIWDRVKLRFYSGHPFASYPGIMNPLASTSGMVWLYKPQVTISENVDYESIGLVHSPQEIHAFTSNKAQTITITGQFISQSVDEAMYAVAALHFMRTVSKMSFGQASAVPIGAPPPVLLLSGYGFEIMNDIPVIVTSFSQDFPNDVDYITIPTGYAAGARVPVAFTITANLVVQRSSNGLRNFNLGTYATNGQYGWW